MSDSRGIPMSVRRMFGYVLAGLAGVALWIVVHLVAAYLNRPSTGHGVTQCIGIGPFGWIGPVLAVVVVGGLAFYLGRIDSGSADVGEGTVEARCLSCGHAISSDWKICPHCGGLTGRTRHADDAPDD